jgi:adenylosuccinate synthase
VLDSLPTVRICTAYTLHGKTITELPTEATDLAACEPVYEDMAGWEQSTVGVETFGGLPMNAQKYLLRIEELAGIPVDMISTGPDRVQTIVMNHPFEQEETNMKHTEERT